MKRTLFNKFACSVFYAGLYNGGPVALVYGMILAISGTLALAASLAEMASMCPIAGAQYHWTAMFSPPRFAPFITWMQGRAVFPPPPRRSNADTCGQGGLLSSHGKLQLLASHILQQHRFKVYLFSITQTTDMSAGTARSSCGQLWPSHSLSMCGASSSYH